MSRRAALLVSALVASSWAATPALALVDTWATWTPITGTSNAFRTTMTQESPGFPAATVATDSRGPVALPAGTLLGATTPPVLKYGSSAGSRYVLLRPRADNATAPSTTTYTFDTPTPDIGWAFVLGDIDADAVRIAATDADGDAVPASEVSTWFSGRFNYAVGPGGDLPTWDGTTSTLTGNPAATDTDGASAWFEPTERLSSLTLTFSRRAGFPVYQTWFVSRARPIGGTVDDVSLAGSCSPDQATTTLLSPSGETLAETRPAPDGTYSFGQFATQAGYVVRLDVPDTCAVVGPAEQAVSNVGEDGDDASRADFEVRAVVPQPVSGTVTDGTGPVAGVVVTLTGPGGTSTTTTAADGTYLFDDNEAGTYTIEVAVPPGYVAGPGGTSISGVVVSTSPVGLQDVELVALPSVSGTVTGGGSGLGGVQVVLTPAGGGTPITVATSGDGSYSLDGVPLGAYTLEAIAPEGYSSPPPRDITVTPAGLTGQDVALARPGAVSGAVTRDGAPAVGVEVVVSGPGRQVVLTTDAEGGYYLGGLGAGEWTVAVRPPTGTVVDGPPSRTVTITAAGEVRGEQDFRLLAAPVTTPTTPAPTTAAPTSGTPSPSPTDGPTEAPTDEPTAEPTDDAPEDQDDSDDPSEQVLPDTGGPSVWLALTSGGLVVAGLVLLVAGRRRARLH